MKVLAMFWVTFTAGCFDYGALTSGRDALMLDADELPDAAADALYGLHPDAGESIDLVQVQVQDLMQLPDFGPVCQGCTPGDKRQGSCGNCSEEVCGKDCTWSACQLKQGNACEYGNGMNTRPCACTMKCGDGQNHANTFNYCQMNCQWGAACVCACFGQAPGNCWKCN